LKITFDKTTVKDYMGYVVKSSAVALAGNSYLPQGIKMLLGLATSYPQDNLY